MELEGSLASFDLSEIFQFIANSKFTGILNLNYESGENAKIYFEEGKIIGAVFSHQRFTLEEILIANNKISRATYNELCEELKKANKPVNSTEIAKKLIDEGYLSLQEIKSVVQMEIEEEILNLFRKKEGNFKFDNLTELKDIFFPRLSIEVEPLIIEGNRRNHEWTKFLAEIPSDKIIYIHKKVDKSFLYSVNLTFTEWQILAYLSGKISVKALLKILKYSAYEIYRGLYNLIKLGLIEPQDLYDVELYSKRIEKTVYDPQQDLPKQPCEIAEEKEKFVKTKGFLFSNILSLFKGTKSSQSMKIPLDKYNFETQIGALIFFTNAFYARLSEIPKFKKSEEDVLLYINLWKERVYDYPRIDIIKFGVEGLEWYKYERFRKFLKNKASIYLKKTDEDIFNALYDLLKDLYKIGEKRVGKDQVQKIYKELYRSIVSTLDNSGKSSIANKIPERVW